MDIVSKIKSWQKKIYAALIGTVIIGAGILINIPKQEAWTHQFSAEIYFAEGDIQIQASDLNIIDSLIRANPINETENSVYINSYMSYDSVGDRRSNKIASIMRTIFPDGIAVVPIFYGDEYCNEPEASKWKCRKIEICYTAKGKR